MSKAGHFSLISKIDIIIIIILKKTWNLCTHYNNSSQGSSVSMTVCSMRRREVWMVQQKAVCAEKGQGGYARCNLCKREMPL